tara:strand:- start:194 stop:1039 length:846 start_codon:yes stop_codon:yes gene_type:complete
MTVLIKYPKQTSQRNKEFFKRKDNELTNLDWAKWAGWFDTDGSFSSTFSKTKKDWQIAVSMKLKDRYPVELFSKIFESSLCYDEFKTITPEPYRKEYMAQVYKSVLTSRKAIWFTKNTYPYLIKEEKKDYAAKLLGYRPESKDFTTWTDDETVHYLATAIDGDGSIQIHPPSKRGFKCIRIDIVSSDPQYLANIVAISANKLNLVSSFKKFAEHKTERGIVDKYRLSIYGSRINLSNFTFFKSLLKYNVMTLDRKKKKIQEFVTCINSKGEKGHTQESRVL